jgi:hypothetical protein
VVQLPGVGPSETPHLVFARSFTQGIGSTKDGRAATLDEDGEVPPPPPDSCPDDDDDDDNCEDDDDEEEEDDD